MTAAEKLTAELAAELDEMASKGTLKDLRVYESPQGPEVRLKGLGEVVVLSSNDYLGMADNPAVIEAGVEALKEYGAGTASVRFICGLFEPHLELERDLAAFLGTGSALTYVSCWTANHAILDALSDGETHIFSDELNHASIIDAMKLARPGGKSIYPHSDMDALEAALNEHADVKRKLVVTDGVFSMEGDLAPLPRLVELCEEHEAVLIVDDSHGLGVMGETGRGTAEHFGLHGKVDIITGTLGKALGGAAGGFVAGSGELCRILEQRSRPQLFSNGLPPTVAASARKSLNLLSEDPGLVARLRDNTAAYRDMLSEAGFDPIPGESPIVPVIVGETSLAISISKQMLSQGVFVTGFGYPVVPEGAARIRSQVSAVMRPEHLERAVAAMSAAMKSATTS
ncbi:MAG: aminotransferase class I/II-fold pyridoxal phosphate-dependent enzyme [Solirubrobacterales bacterium]|nr:aminotransferase class I/II-fold pyridoxal phosphate-dependent enzyme [Solirubrobacterales bacterium]OJU93481.1 MAG: glycine C-acetyltransferase [Solirubrobacterales bacterium 67-14]